MLRVICFMICEQVYLSIIHDASVLVNKIKGFEASLWKTLRKYPFFDSIHSRVKIKSLFSRRLVWLPIITNAQLAYGAGQRRICRLMSTRGHFAQNVKVKTSSRIVFSFASTAVITQIKISFLEKPILTKIRQTPTFVPDIYVKMKFGSTIRRLK